MRREVKFKYKDKEIVCHQSFPVKDRDKSPQIFELVIGQKYCVEPINKLKNKKNRNRICTVGGIQRWLSHCGKSETFRARVIWQDDGRFGFIDPCDLVSC